MRERVARTGAIVAAAGLVALVIGTFLPWLRSGTALRDSYQSIGALRGPAGAAGVATAPLDAWLFITPASAAGIALYVLGARRVGAGVAGIVSLAVGTVAAVVAVQPGDGGALVGVAGSGPIVTLIGATVALLGAITVMVCPRGGQARTSEGSP